LSRKRYFIAGLVLIIILSALDLITTWILTPDLRNEANPFISWYGMGWLGIILINIAYICFVTIPFYYHCLVFNSPNYSKKKPSIKRVGLDYFLGNHKNPFFSVGMALLNVLGFYLFWWYTINKITAVLHNTLIIIGSDFKDLSFSRRIEVLYRIDSIFLFTIMFLFISGIIYRARNMISRKLNTNSIHYLLIAGFILFYISFRLFIAFAKPIHSVKLTEKVDPDIVLVNIGELDRVHLGNLLLSIDSCSPILIGIDVYFQSEQDRIQDSVLLQALSIIKNDILVYELDSAGKPLISHENFRSVASDEGLLHPEEVNRLLSRFSPTKQIDGKIHEQFALKIVKHWKPEFKHNIKTNQSISIKFSRTLNQFIYFNSTDFKKNNLCDYLKNKVVLLGYLGPSDEDKHFTPIRLVREFTAKEPDTYGLVIIANEIRTILDYERKD